MYKKAVYTFEFVLSYRRPYVDDFHANQSRGQSLMMAWRGVPRKFGGSDNPLGDLVPKPK